MAHKAGRKHKHMRGSVMPYCEGLAEDFLDSFLRGFADSFAEGAASHSLTFRNSSSEKGCQTGGQTSANPMSYQMVADIMVHNSCSCQ